MEAALGPLELLREDDTKPTERKRARLSAGSCAASLHGCRGWNAAPLAKCVAVLGKKPFCVILGLMTFLRMAFRSSWTEMLFAHPRILRTWLFCLQKPSPPCLMASS